MTDRQIALNRLNQAITNFDRFDRGTYGRLEAVNELSKSIDALITIGVREQLSALSEEQRNSAQPDGKS